MKKLVVVLFLTIMVGIAFGSGIDDNETSGEAGAEGENSISGDSTSGDATSEDETSGDSSNDISGIGRGHYIPRSELTRSVLGIGSIIFKSDADKCVVKSRHNGHNFSKLYLFQRTENFYDHIAIESSLSATFRDGFSLGATLEYASSSFESSSLKLNGVSLDIYNAAAFLEFKNGCIDSTLLDEKFKKDFENLPSLVQKPSTSDHWDDYRRFINKYGSHVATRATIGARYTLFTFSKSSSNIDENKVHIKACASAKTLNVEAFGCAQFTEKDYAEVANLVMGQSKTIRGGTNDARTRLQKHPTEENLNSFLASAGKTDDSIIIGFKNIWDILEQAYPANEHHQKIDNLKSYYLGFLRMGCQLQRVYAPVDEMYVVLKKFTKDDQSNKWECMLAPIGCQSDHDCHIKRAKSSYCYGESCVIANSFSDPRIMRTEGRTIQYHQDTLPADKGANFYCARNWKVRGYCKHNHVWTRVWPDYGQQENSTASSARVRDSCYFYPVVVGFTLMRYLNY